MNSNILQVSDHRKYNDDDSKLSFLQRKINELNILLTVEDVDNMSRYFKTDDYRKAFILSNWKRISDKWRWTRLLYPFYFYKTMMDILITIGSLDYESDASYSKKIEILTKAMNPFDNDIDKVNVFKYLVENSSDLYFTCEEFCNCINQSKLVSFTQKLECLNTVSTKLLDVFDNDHLIINMGTYMEHKYALTNAILEIKKKHSIFDIIPKHSLFLYSNSPCIWK